MPAKATKFAGDNTSKSKKLSSTTPLQYKPPKVAKNNLFTNIHKGEAILHTFIEAKREV